MGLLTTIKTSITWALGLSGDYLGAVRQAFPDLDLRWGSGTGSSQADQPWADIGATLANSATRNLDLRALTGQSGATLTMAEVRMIRITSDVDLTIAKGASNGWTGLGASFSMLVVGGGTYILVNPTNGKMATGASDKVLDITNSSGGTATYSIEVIGVSA